MAAVTFADKTVWTGDNLDILRGLNSECVDLIYLDPPFNSNRQYNSIYKDETGRPLPDEIEAFFSAPVLAKWETPSSIENEESSNSW